MVAVEVTTVEIFVALGVLFLGPFGSAWVGTKKGLNGAKKDIADVKSDVAEIKRQQTDQITRQALSDQRVNMIVRHCEYIHDQPISEHIVKHDRPK